jgi:hypothetical protein
MKCTHHPKTYLHLYSSLRLAKTIELEGGVAKIIITHSDDIQDHDKWKARFPEAQRIMHR